MGNNARMSAEESTRFKIEESYGQVAHQAYCEGLGKAWTRKAWLALQPRERGAWMEAASAVRATFGAACLI